jgi:general secretion pathway protein J
MTPSPTNTRSAGFTLVEALAATLLMSFILAALAIVTGQWLPNWDRGAARAQRADLLALGLDRVTDDLAAAEFISADVQDKFPIFVGAELSVVFVRTTLAPNVGTGIEVVRIAETSDSSGLAVVRSTAPLPIGSGQSGESDTLLFANPVVMTRAPYRVTFSYAGPDRVWRNTWQGQAALPRAVRVLLRDNATSEILAASTSTLINAELPARCTWPASVGACPELGGLLGTASVSSSAGGATAPAVSGTAAPIGGGAAAASAGGASEAGSAAAPPAGGSVAPVPMPSPGGAGPALAPVPSGGAR